MNLAEEIVVAGLTGKPAPKVSGKWFQFLRFNPERERQFDILAEGPKPFDVLRRAARQPLFFDGDEPFTFWRSVDSPSYDPADWPGFEDLPAAIRDSGDRDLIGFFLFSAEDQAFSFSTEDTVYLDEDTIGESLPDGKFVFAWDAEAPRQEEALGLFAVPPKGKPRPRTAEEKALLRAVSRDPGDDTPRLAYADWLDENDRPERAEFIRAQIDGHDGEELFAEHGEAWRAELPDLDGVCWGGWRRGFVCAAAVGDVAAFGTKNYADAFFAAAPVQKLFVRDHRAVAGLTKLLARPELAHLELLDLSGCPLTPAAVKALAACPHLGRLEALRLNRCGLGTSASAVLVRAANWPHLRQLWLLENAGIGAEAKAAVRERFGDGAKVR
jgi:uncharacterized protein (TIGR02996 family)